MRVLVAGATVSIGGTAATSVVVVNPTHVAVALRYDPVRGAPRVLAKGSGTIAAKIREKTLGIMSPAFADSLEARASVLKDMGRQADSDKDAALAATIRRSEKKSK